MHFISSRRRQEKAKLKCSDLGYPLLILDNRDKRTGAVQKGIVVITEKDRTGMRWETLGISWVQALTTLPNLKENIGKLLRKLCANEATRTSTERLRWHILAHY